MFNTVVMIEADVRHIVDVDGSQPLDMETHDMLCEPHGPPTVAPLISMLAEPA